MYPIQIQILGRILSGTDQNHLSLDEEGIKVPKRCPKINLGPFFKILFLTTPSPNLTHLGSFRVVLGAVFQKFSNSVTNMLRHERYTDHLPFRIKFGQFHKVTSIFCTHPRLLDPIFAILGYF